MEYTLIRSDRKTGCITVNDDLQIIARVPKSAKKSDIDRFISSKEKEILNLVEKRKAWLETFNISDAQLEQLIKSADAVIPGRVAYYSSMMGLEPSNVKITKAKKRFGSCSGKNALCFSCYLMLKPMEAVDYVVVHELAHIKHHDHSKAFYQLIEKYMPDYRQRKALLKSV